MPNQDINDVFTQNLKDLLEKNSMNYSQLANRTGVGKSTISMWMSGKSLPRMEMLDILANILGVTAGYLTTDHSATGKVEAPTTLAAHFDGDEFTAEELNEIKRFAEFVKSKRKTM